ncbi:MAG: ABC transporter ATP-binding protein [Fluviibacter sp.]
MSFFTSLQCLASHISNRRRLQLLGLIVLMLFGSLAEMATLGAVVPFLALLADPSMVNNYPFMQTVFGWFGTSEADFLLSAGILFSLVAMSAAVVRMLMMWSCMKFSYGLGADIGAEVYRRTLYQPYSWHVSRNSSEILAGIDKVNHLVNGVLTPLVQGTVAFVIAFGILSMLLVIDTQTALIAGIGFSVLYGITTLTLRNQLAHNSKIISSTAIRRIQAVQEGLGGIRDILLDATQPVYNRRFATYDYELRRAQSTNAVFGASPRYVIEAFGMILIVALAYWLSPRQGGLSSAIPVLGALAIGAQKLLPQMQQVYSSWSSISGSRNQLEDVLNLLALPIPQDSKNNKTVPLVRCHGEGNLLKNKQSDDDTANPLVALRNVSFRYKPDAPEVLQGISLEIPNGSRIGIIGKTGSGKSTLIDLIMGLLEPTAGQIEIDGQALVAQNLRTWQQRIAHVPQSIYLSDASIAENIAFGIPSTYIDEARLEQAAAQAQLADFIQSLPQHYQTPVGERGVCLSGGQRQRIGLARALYKQADLLVLDEATSALDSTTEKSVIDAVNALGKNITILMIAHRTTTLTDCDFIVEITAAQ